MIRLLTVGQSGIELDGKRLTTESEIVFGMLLYLAARAGDTVSRDEAQALFWPGLTHARGRHCLRQALYRLRQVGVPLRADNASIGVALGDISSDFAALMATDAPAALYRQLATGEILPGYQPAFSSPFAEWVEEFRSRISLRIRQGMVRTIIDLRSKGRYREAEPLARACLTSDPFNEIATLTLAEATAVLNGNRAEAMAVLDRYMDEVGTPTDKRVTLSASVLRRRISERFVEQRYAAPPEPPFVGREEVLQQMVERMQEAVAGRSTVAYLWGEPGIGKTRLLDELSKVANVQGVHVERYTVSPNDSDRALALFSSVLPRLITMSGAVGICTEAYDAIQRFIDPMTWERVEPPGSVAEAELAFQKLKSGICELFDVLSEECALALVIDDVHWIDRRSLEVLSEVVDAARSRRIAFVLTSREACTVGVISAFPALCARAGARQLHGLEPAEIKELLTQIADQRSFALTPDFVRQTVATSAGNPLFVSQLATHYAWNGLRNDLPHDMQTLLQRRLEALSNEALLVFQTCGVLGEHATAERIAQVLQIPTYSLLRALTEIEGSSLFSAEPARVVCRHDLLRREALAKLTPVAREALHRQAALVLEATALAEMSATIGWHAVHAWLDAAQPNRALRLVTRIAGRLLSSGLAQDADALLDRARGAMQELPLVMELLPLQLRAARARGNLRRSLDLALECQQLSRKLPARSRDSLLAELAAFDASRGLDALRPHLNVDLCRIEASVEPPDVLLELALRVVIAADDCIDPITARRCFGYLNKHRTLERATADVRGIFQLVYHSHFGDLDIAVDRARAVVAGARRRRSEDFSTRARRLRWAHRPLMICGHFDEAIAALDQSIAAGQNCGSSLDEVASRCYRIDVLVSSGRLDEALQTLAEIDRKASNSLGRLVQTTIIGARSDLLFALGRADELREVIRSVDDGEVHPREHTRTRLGIDSLHILQALLCGCEPDVRRVERVLGSWHNMRDIGAADTVFLAASAALVVRGEDERAAEMCVGYHEARRERWPIPEPIARQFSAMLGGWGVKAPQQFDRLGMSTSTDSRRMRPAS